MPHNLLIASLVLMQAQIPLNSIAVDEGHVAQIESGNTANVEDGSVSVHAWASVQVEDILQGC